MLGKTGLRMLFFPLLCKLILRLQCNSWLSFPFLSVCLCGDSDGMADDAADIFGAVIIEMQEQFGGRLPTPTELSESVGLDKGECKKILQEYKKELKDRNKKDKKEKTSTKSTREIAQRTLPATVGKKAPVPEVSTPAPEVPKKAPVPEVLEEATPSELCLLDGEPLEDGEEEFPEQDPPQEIAAVEPPKKRLRKGESELFSPTSVASPVPSAALEEVWMADIKG